MTSFFYRNGETVDPKLVPYLALNIFAVSRFEMIQIASMLAEYIRIYDFLSDQNFDPVENLNFYSLLELVFLGDIRCK